MEQPAPKPAELSPPPEDPTEKALARLSKATASEVEADKADRRAAALDTPVGGRGRVAAMEAAGDAGSSQIAGLTSPRRPTRKRGHGALDAERDVLAKERDALKAALFKASQRSGFAVCRTRGPMARGGADRAGMRGRRRQATPKGADVHGDGSVAADQSAVESPGTPRSHTRCCTSKIPTLRMEPPRFHTWFSWSAQWDSPLLRGPFMS